MRYRALAPGDDYSVGKPFLANSPACVGQAVLTRLRLWVGEWFTDVTDGTPYNQQVLGHNNSSRNPDAYIKQRILTTPNVTSLISYASTYDGASRAVTISATINTLYGQITVTAKI